MLHLRLPTLDWDSLLVSSGLRPFRKLSNTDEFRHSYGNDCHEASIHLCYRHSDRVRGPGAAIYFMSVFPRSRFFYSNSSSFNHATIVSTAPTYTINASLEVILSAGSINTPLILMLSGIGPTAQLSSHGIATRVNAPNVGQGLQVSVNRLFRQSKDIEARPNFSGSSGLSCTMDREYHVHER